MFKFWTGEFCSHFGCVNIMCKIKRLIIKRTVYTRIKRLSARMFFSRSETQRTRSECKFGSIRTEHFERSLELWLDAVYCYRRSSVIYLIGLSVCWSRS